MRKAMTAALDSLTIFLHPQIYFCDETRSEDFVFVEKYRAKVAKEDKPLLELPKDSAERLMWITRLDTGSLNGELILNSNDGGSSSQQHGIRPTSIYWFRLRVTMLVLSSAFSSLWKWRITLGSVTPTLLLRYHRTWMPLHVVYLTNLFGHQWGRKESGTAPSLPCARGLRFLL